MEIKELKLKLEDAINFDPFEGDFGDGNDCTLKDKIVTARKEHTCYICNGTVKVGELARNMVQVFEGQIGSWYFCQECCIAMTKIFEYNNDIDSEEDQDELDKRYTLGHNRRNGVKE
jgi:hypothetical protein